jgi:hypothetical protein
VGELRGAARLRRDGAESPATYGVVGTATEDRMFKRVVAGCDGSPEGRDAAALGASIASATAAGVSLVGV